LKFGKSKDLIEWLDEEFKQDTGMKVADKNYCLRIGDETKADEEGFKDKMKERIKLIKTQGYEGELAKLSQIHNQRN